MKRLIESLAERSLIFSFLSGAFIALAGNFATSSLLWDSGSHISVSRLTINCLAVLMLVASIGSFLVSAMLDAARRDWEVAGSQLAMRSVYLHARSRHILIGLCLSVGGFAISFLLIVKG